MHCTCTALSECHTLSSGAQCTAQPWEGHALYLVPHAPTLCSRVCYKFGT